MSPSAQRLVAYAYLASSMVLTGSYVALSKPLVAVLPVFLLAWLRFAIAALAMLPWLRAPAHEPPLTAQVKWLIFMESFFGNFLFSICMLYGVSMTSAVSASVIMASIPAVIALMSWGFLRDGMVLASGLQLAAPQRCGLLGNTRANISAGRSGLETTAPSQSAAPRPPAPGPSVCL